MIKVKADFKYDPKERISINANKDRNQQKKKQIIKHKAQLKVLVNTIPHSDNQSTIKLESLLYSQTMFERKERKFPNTEADPRSGGC